MNEIIFWSALFSFCFLVLVWGYRWVSKLEEEMFMDAFDEGKKRPRE